MASSSTLTIVLQIIFGILATYIVYWIFLKVANRTKLVPSTEDLGYDRRSDTLIVDGRADGGSLANNTFDTVNPGKTNYVKMTRSLNLKGGAQFSYSMWMQIRDPSADLNDRVILLRGDDKTYRVKKTDKKTGISTFEAYRVKCPLIRFGRIDGEGVMSFVVEANAINDPNLAVTVAPRRDVEDSTLHKNLWSLLNKNWMLVSFVFSDHVPIDDFEDGIEISVFINDIRYAIARVRDTLVQNDGKLYLFPNLGLRTPAANGVSVAHLKYHNYALGTSDLRAMVQQGVPMHGYKQREIKTTPLHLSEYNKLDIYNV
jgi:hypothetical protein